MEDNVEEVKKEKIKPRDKPHYVNNAQFSASVVEYVLAAKAAEAAGEPIPVVTDYIASCFLKIAEGLSHKANFVRYTYREEMMMDAVEDCLKRIKNFNVETKTRTGKPNAFAYFTQISWYAFLRRIEKEKRQQDIKIKYMTQTGLDQLIYEEFEHNPAARAAQAFVDDLRSRIDVVRDKDKKIAEKKPRKKRTVHADSDLSGFME